VRGWLEQVVSVGQCDSLRPAVHAELEENVLDMCPDGLRADDEALSDLALAKSFD
jgi:hypothetical protein